MSPGIWQILLVVILGLLLFGRGKISSVMGDVAKGINAFKRGMKDGAEEDAEKMAINQDKDAINDAAARSKAESLKG